MEKISIIIPCYNEENTIKKTFKKLEEVKKLDFNSIEFEYIFVNDGSKDYTLGEIKQIAEKNINVKYISISKNLTYPPELLHQMHGVVKSSAYDSCGVKIIDKTSKYKIRKMLAKWFSKVINKMSGASIVDGATDYRMYTRKMADVIANLPEGNKYLKGISNIVGYETKWIDYNLLEEVEDEKKIVLNKVIKKTWNNVMSFSTSPIMIAAIIGIIMCIGSIICGIGSLIKTYYFGSETSGWTSIMFAITFIGGMQFFIISVCCKYIANVCLEIRKRPSYIIDEIDVEVKEIKLPEVKKEVKKQVVITDSLKKDIIKNIVKKDDVKKLVKSNISK